jgi:hypothetical protein
MEMSRYLLSVFLFLLLTFFGRFIRQKAMKKPNQELKAGQAPFFSKDRLFQFGFIILFLMVFYGLHNVKSFPSRTLFYGFVSTMMVTQPVFSWLAIQKTSKKSFSSGVY